MLPLQVCVDQIPAGARPAASAPPALRISAAPAAASSAPPPPGLYVRVAGGLDPPEAVRASLEFVQRMGADRPPFMRGVAVREEGRSLVQMFAGPFRDEGSARGFCARALAGEVCVVRPFSAAEGAAKSR